MSEENKTVGYGYEDDSVKPSGINATFGLNAGIARLVKFEWINNGGKEGAEAEALDIQFMTEGSSKPYSYRLFPITKAFKRDGTEVTDPKDPDFQNAFKNFNALVVHILHCFVDNATIKTALSGSIANFKDFCKITMSLLPKNYDQIPLDLFFQWQWQLRGEAKQTYLELPNKMTHGAWVCKAVPALNEDGSAGQWKAVEIANPADNVPIALKYVDGQGNQHPFTRNGWFMNNPFSKKQMVEGSAAAAESLPEAPAASATW